MSKLIFNSSVMMKVVTTWTLLLMFPVISLSQNVWESFGTSSSPWSISTDLECAINTPSKVDIYNMNYPSEDNVKNKTWSVCSASINTSNYNESPLDIAFTIKNLSSPTNNSLYLNTSAGTTKWYYSNERYWKVQINYTTTSGQSKYYDMNYSTIKDSNKDSTYHSSNYSDNGNSSKWESITWKNNRIFRVLFDDNKINIFDQNGDNLVKTIYGVKKINSVRVGAGPGTQLWITNTSCQKMTIYGQSQQYLQRAENYMANNNPSAAVSEMTTAINKELKCYDTYLMRGIAYYVQGYYKSAIEDLSSAINYSANNKEMAYYYRGMSKLALNDDYGISDLRNGGQNGLAFLRENNLMNYTPGQNKKKTTTNTAKKKTTSSQSKKPELKK